MIKIEFKGTVTRVYEETRGLYTSKYIVAVEENSGKYPNVLRFKLTQDSTVSVDVGANVAISAYLDGREWTNPQGATMYFTDLRIDTVSVLSAAPAAVTAGQAGAKPTIATNGKELLALGAAYGEDQASVNARCVAHKAKVNRQFTAADWQAVADEIIVAHSPATNAPASSEFDDGLPF